MDVVKVAFDTLIVGALALPWLAVLVRVFQPPGNKGKAEDHLVPLAALPEHTKDAVADHLVPLAALPEHTKDAVAGIVILALGYFLGSAVSRISDDFFDDEELAHTFLPTEASIRQDVYKHEYCTVQPNKSQTQKLKRELIPDATDLCPKQQDKNSPEVVMEFFRLQEAKLLLQGQDRTARLRELYSQTVILRGATLNGMILSTLCLFGFCVTFRRQPIAVAQAAGVAARTRSSTTASGVRSRWREVGLINGVAVALIIYGASSLCLHFKRLSGADPYNDPPLAELTICLLGIAGLLARAEVESRRRYARASGLSFALTLIAYGAWWWTSVVYYQTVIHAFQTTT